MICWNKKDSSNKKRAKSRWMLIGFGQSVEVKVDEEEEEFGPNNAKDEKSDTLDSFYDPICNLGIGRKGGLIHYLRMVGQEAKLQKGMENTPCGSSAARKNGAAAANSAKSTKFVRVPQKF